MQTLKSLLDRIVERVNISLRETGFDAAMYVPDIEKLLRYINFSALCGLSVHLPLHFKFSNSCLAGSYFLNRCSVDSSVVLQTDIRGDELKREGRIFNADGLAITLYQDEEIRIIHSYLDKALVHSHSHDPNFPEIFRIENTIALPYTNIHGSTVIGSLLGASSTVDLTAVQDSVVGEFAYVQVGELAHHIVAPGQVWINAHGRFDFKYQYDSDALAPYIRHEPFRPPEGSIVDFVAQRQPEFELAFDQLRGRPATGEPPAWSASSPYAIVKGDCRFGDNVFVAQRAYVENALLGPGSNAQENCFIIESRLNGYNVTAHGGKVIRAELGQRAFVGFNAFIRGTAEHPVKIGAGSIIMPHTIIDTMGLEAGGSLDVPPDTLVWGLITSGRDLDSHCLPLADLAKVQRKTQVGEMMFHGAGEDFVTAFKDRIAGILMANGAFFDGTSNRGHAQMAQNIAFNIIQPYQEGGHRGMFPSVEIRV